MTEFKSIKGSLLATPVANRDESLASWLQRICGAHQYSMTRLRDVCNFSPSLEDWDSSLIPHTVVDLLERSKVSDEVCAEARSTFGSLLRHYKKKSVLLFSQGKPYYRWCGLCMAENRVPYLKWEWRIAAVMHCVSHKVSLVEQCSWCDGKLFVNNALLVSAGRTTGVPDLGVCQHCEMSLWYQQAQHQATSQDAQRLHQLMEFVQAVRLADADGKSLSEMSGLNVPDVGWLVRTAPRSLRTPRDRAPKAVPTRMEILDGFRPVHRVSPDEEVALPSVDEIQVGKLPPRWSDGLCDADRKRLALALHIIRSELRSASVDLSVAFGSPRDWSTEKGER